VPADFPYPLKFWALQGFRAIRDKTDFHLGGLNVLVGANSAGKSSVLHSLLLTAQTLATPMADRPLVLNGNLVRLGLASDCVHEQTGQEITLGFGINPASVDLGRPVMNEVTQVDVHGRFAVVADESTTFRLSQSDFSAHLTEGKAHLTVKARTQDEAEKTLLAEGADADLAKQHADGVGLGVSGDLPEKTVGVYPRQFLPNTLAVLVNAYVRELDDLLGVWRPRIGVRMREGTKAQAALSQPVADLLRAFLQEVTGADAEHLLPPGQELTREYLNSLPDSVTDQIRRMPRTAWFNEHATDLPFKGEVENQMMVNVLDASVDYVRWWFSRHVRHLGPLRAAPQPLYGLPEAASGASVGQNGEYTAAVLTTYGKRVESVPMPNGKVEAVRLSTAVDRWVKELGLLAAVHPRERGKFGYELNVSIEGVDRPMDLTTVGVGVSQALPIIVLGLIADPGSLLLFEQPELHLHPDVQAALGDFFLALARSGRQLIIETHSEYLINRLRRRQVTDDDPDAAELVRLFFFERDGPSAKVTATRIGTDGSMPEWPQGFLDTAAREIQAMVLKDSD
jgi:predicted ATPase